MLIYSFITDYQAFSLRYKDNTTRDKNETKVGKQSANLGKNNEPIQNRLSFLIDCKSVILHHLTILSFPMVRPAWDNWWLLVALSGVALITHHSNPDSLITVEEFRRIATGETTEWKGLNPDSKLGCIQVVFDNPNSGTVHYVIDSICQGKPLSPSLKALKSNEEVIDYVATTPDALGVIGANWIGNKTDTTRLSFNQRVRVMSVSGNRKATPENSYRPYQAYLALKKYPLTHEVYILINDPKGALPTGLMTFLTRERGQRIILKSGLVPATQPVRIVNVKDDF